MLTKSILAAVALTAATADAKSAFASKPLTKTNWIEDFTIVLVERKVFACKGTAKATNDEKELYLTLSRTANRDAKAGNLTWAGFEQYYQAFRKELTSEGYIADIDAAVKKILYYPLELPSASARTWEATDYIIQVYGKLLNKTENPQNETMLAIIDDLYTGAKENYLDTSVIDTFEETIKTTDYDFYKELISEFSLDGDDIIAGRLLPSKLDTAASSSGSKTGSSSAPPAETTPAPTTAGSTAGPSAEVKTPTPTKSGATVASVSVAVASVAVAMLSLFA